MTNCDVYVPGLITLLDRLNDTRGFDRARRQTIDFIELHGMLTAPVAQGRDNWPQAQSQFRRGIVDPRRHLGEHLTRQEPVFLHFAYLLDQHLLAHVGYQPAEFR